jgi:hypothetical protein
MTILDPNGECNSIVLEYYTWNPSRPLDAYQLKVIKNENAKNNYLPHRLFLCKETWEWDGWDYKKTSFEETMLSGKETHEVNKLLKYNKAFKQRAFGITDVDKYKVPVYHLGHGGRWTKPIQYEE